MDLYPIAIFNDLISIQCGKYYFDDNTFSITIFIQKFLPKDLKPEKLSALFDTLDLFRETFLNSSTKHFDINKVDYITRKMDPIKKELFELVLIRYYQILTIEFSRFFENVLDLISFSNKHQFNEKILCGVKYFQPICDTTIFSPDDFSFSNECVHHQLMHKKLIRNILSNVEKNNGIKFPD